MLLHRTAFSFLVVIFQPEVGNELLILEVTQRVLKLHRLNKQIVFGIEAGRGHRRLQVEAEPLLYADTRKLIAPFSQIQKQNQVQRNRSRKDGIPAQEIDFDLHGISQPAEDIDIVPTL